MQKQTHIIRLQDFKMEDGKIPFSMLLEIANGLKSVSAGALRLLMEGHSNKKGTQPEWLKKSIDFELSGLKPGSTVLEIEAPVLKDTMQKVQVPIPYGDLDFNELSNGTALGLGIQAFQQAFDNDGDTSLLDKQLLKEMQGFKRLFKTRTGRISFGNNQGTNLELSQERFKEIKKLEESIPPSMTARITGKLDLMRHSNASVQLLTAGKVIRAFLTKALPPEEVIGLFGEEVTTDGIAHFNAKKELVRFEIKKIRLATSNDEFFKQLPVPLSNQLSIVSEAQSSGYQGTELGKVMGKWPGDETLDELIEMLD